MYLYYLFLHNCKTAIDIMTTGEFLILSARAPWTVRVRAYPGRKRLDETLRQYPDTKFESHLRFEKCLCKLKCKLKSINVFLNE